MKKATNLEYYKYNTNNQNNSICINTSVYNTSSKVKIKMQQNYF